MYGNMNLIPHISASCIQLLSTSSTIADHELAEQWWRHLDNCNSWSLIGWELGDVTNMEEWLVIVIGVAATVLVLAGITACCVCRCWLKKRRQRNDLESSRRRQLALTDNRRGDQGRQLGEHGGREQFLDKDSIPPDLVIDLHGFYVKDAINTTTQFISQRSKAYGQSHHSESLRYVYIVTGRGLHSEGGVPRVKPATEELLHDRHLQFTWMNKGGMMKVDLKSDRRNVS